jgi:hypothetical protein
LACSERGHVPDLVQEQRAAVRDLEFPQPRLDSRRDAALDSEQLRLEKRLRKRRAIDRDEGLLRTVAARVNHPGNELLARAALPRQEHRNLRARDAPDQIENPARGRRVADEEATGRRAAGLVEQPPVLLLEAFAFSGEALEVPAVLDRHSGKAREGRQETGVLFVERCALSAPLFLFGEHEGAHRTATGPDRNPDRREHRGSQEPKAFANQGTLRPENVAKKLVFRDDGLRLAPREANPCLGLARAPLAESRQVPARRVEHTDGAAENVLDERILARERTERAPRVVQGFEEKELVLSLERRDRPVHYFADARTCARRSSPTAVSAGRVGAQLGFHRLFSSRSFSARSI